MAQPWRLVGSIGIQYLRPSVVATMHRNTQPRDGAFLSTLVKTISTGSCRTILLLRECVSRLEVKAPIQVFVHVIHHAKG